MAQVEDATQPLSLMGHPVQEDAHAEHLDNNNSSSFRSPSGRRSTFWKGLFRKRSSGGSEGDHDQDAFEDSALLNTSASDFDYRGRRRDDDELDDYRDESAGDSSHRRGRRLLVGGRAINESSDDEGEEDGTNWNEKDQKDASMGHSLLLGEEDEDEETDGTNGYSLFNMNAFNKKEASSDDDSEEDSDEDGEESGESDDDYGNEEEEGSQQPKALPSMPRVVPGQPLRNFLRRTQSTTSSASYTDDPNNDDSSYVSSNNRKNIHGRIEGFGSKALPDGTGSPERFANARNLRDRLRELTSSYRMRKMTIGTEETLQRKTWIERFDDVVDRVLPPDPELDGYIDAFRVKDQAKKTPPPLESTGIDTKMPTSSSGAPMNHRRQQLGPIDDASYIFYLERELRNKELELDSWKRRAKELDRQVKRLNGEEVYSDDDDDSSHTSSNGQQQEGESEIEWQTGVAEEGQLIEVEDPIATESSPSRMQRVVSQDSSEDGSIFMMMHAPDGPSSDDDDDILAEQETEHEIFEPETPSSKARNTTQTAKGEAEFFPVLSSQNNDDSGTIWMDVIPPPKSAPIQPVVAFTDGEKTEHKQPTSHGHDKEHNSDTQYDAMGDGEAGNNVSRGEDEDEDGFEEGSEEEEEEEEEDGARIVALQEGTLIELCQNAPKEDAPTVETMDLSTAVVSEDEDSLHEKEDMLLDLKESPPPLGIALASGLAGDGNGVGSLIELGP